MSVDATKKTISPTVKNVDWEHPTPPTDLIFDDGEPLESNRHRIAMNVLIESLEQAWSDRTDFFVGGNMFVYYSSAQVKNKDFRGPDFFVVLDVDGTISRQGWVVWEEEGRYPDVIVELMSPSTAEVDITTKKDIYERTFKTREYYVFDPFDPGSLRGWGLNGTQLRYKPLIPNEKGWLWCETLGFWLGTWEGTIHREPAVWLRFYDSAGNLVLLPNEAAKLKMEEEERRAEQEKLRAEQEKLRAEQERERAERERERSDRLAAQLRALGIEPDN
jgi:Uma2 family endonuclease